MIANKFRRLICLSICAAVLLSCPSPVAAAEETIDILLIGQDGRDGLEGKRSDTMILCSYNPGNRTLTMVSFLRDLYLPIPGKSEDRLNAAYAWGGQELLRRTLEENFGLDIDGYVEVDFDRFSQIIDALGGVRITLREDEARSINRDCPGSSVTHGEQLLSGQEALYYARIRELDPDGDFSRTRRQQTLLKAMLRSWIDADLSAMLVTMRKLLPMVSTDLSPVQLLDWIFSAEPARKSLNLNSIQIPRQELCQDRIIRGMAVLVCDLEREGAYLRQCLTGS